MIQPKAFLRCDNSSIWIDLQRQPKADICIFGIPYIVKDCVLTM